MPDYKALYLEMFRASERAMRILEQAQRDAEAAVLDAEAPPLRLDVQETSAPSAGDASPPNAAEPPKKLP